MDHIVNKFGNIVDTLNHKTFRSCSISGMMVINIILSEREDCYT